jgi:hypothetical protein
MITSINEFKKTLKINEISNYVDSEGYGRDDEGNTFYVTNKRYWDTHNERIPRQYIREIPERTNGFTTKQIADKLNKKSIDVNRTLSKLGLITYVNQGWELTIAGKNKGGKAINGKYGVFVIWPEDIINLIKAQEPAAVTTPETPITPTAPTATSYGGTLSTKQLSALTGIASAMINNTLERLGLMSKTGSNWRVTDEGKAKGGKQMTGQYGDFVVWPSSIKDVLVPSA